MSHFYNTNPNIPLYNEAKNKMNKFNYRLNLIVLFQFTKYSVKGCLLMEKRFWLFKLIIFIIILLMLTHIFIITLPIWLIRTVGIVALLFEGIISVSVIKKFIDDCLNGYEIHLGIADLLNSIMLKK
jgi:hypothetical protein